MSLLGLDIGTTGCKAGLFDEGGRLLHLEYREYPLEMPQPGRMELNPERVWRRLLDCLQAISRASRRDPPEALAIASQGEAITAVDGSGGALANSILSFDSRAVGEVEALNQSVGRARFFQRTGVNLHPMITVAKLRWWKDHDPELYAKAKWFLGYPDFVLHRLGLAPVMDFSMAARTGGFDIHQRCWSDEIFSALELEPTRLARTAEAGTAVGELGQEGSRLTGLPKTMLVAVGGHDQCCAALGAGVTAPGEALYTLGTVEGVMPVFSEFMTMLGENDFPCYPHVVPGAYVSAGFNFTGGILLRWYRDQFFSDSQKKGDEIYRCMLGDLPPEPTGLFVLPYFTMSGTPYFDTEPRGAILGLSLQSTRRQITRALIEGLSYETALNLDLMVRADIQPRSLRALGGGAKSLPALQVRADVLGRPIEIPDITEGAAFGAALIAGASAGVFENFSETAADLVSISTIVEPDPERHARYRQELQRYKKIYPVLKEI